MRRSALSVLLVLGLVGVLGLPATGDTASASDPAYFDMGQQFAVEYRGLARPVRVQLVQRTAPDVQRVRVRVSSDSDPVGLLLTLTRELRASPYFFGAFGFTAGPTVAEDALLRVADGDTFRITDLTTSSGVRAPDLVETWHAGSAPLDGMEGRIVAFSDATPGAARVTGAPSTVEPGAMVTVTAPGGEVLATATGAEDGSFVATFDNTVANHPEVQVSVQESVGPPSPAVAVHKAAVTGRVLRSDGTPVASAEVHVALPGASPLGELTRADGVFSVSHQRMPGTGQGQARAWEQLPPDQGPSAWRDVSWDGVRTSDVGTLRLTGPTFTGRLVDEDGRPVHEAELESDEHVDIYGHPLTYNAYADADGRFARWLPDGTYTFTGRQPLGCDPMWLDGPLTVSISGGRSTPHDPTLVLRGAPAQLSVEIPEPAAPGGDVAVALPSPGGEVTLELSDVVGGGEAYAGCHRTPPLSVTEPTLPDGLDLTVEGPDFSEVEVCAPYVPDQVLAAGFTEERLTLLHVPDGGGASDITTSIDRDTKQVCGVTTSFSTFLVGSADRGALRVDRWAGRDRFETAARVSAETTGTGTDVAYVATGGDYPDALAAGPVAAAVSAPILLVGRDVVPAATRAELTRLRPRRIVLLGGVGAVSAEVEAELRALAVGGRVERLAGATRLHTAVAVSRAHIARGAEVVYLATGATFPDALAAGSPAAAGAGPVLLVEQDRLPDVVAEELRRLRPREVVVAGGARAVSAAVLDAVRATVPRAGVRRVAGADRFATAALLAVELDASETGVAFVATGLKFPDALTGAAAAGRAGAPLLLALPEELPDPVAQQLRRHAPRRVVLLGGAGVLAPSHEAAIQALLAPR